MFCLFHTKKPLETREVWSAHFYEDVKRDIRKVQLMSCLSLFQLDNVDRNAPTETLRRKVFSEPSDANQCVRKKSYAHFYNRNECQQIQMAALSERFQIRKHPDNGSAPHECIQTVMGCDRSIFASLHTTAAAGRQREDRPTLPRLPTVWHDRELFSDPKRSQSVWTALTL
ncbi:hypothetical protein JOB18_046298 [Solea senegalensis]|uniref:Uncharacterized protein n=1 Tax=Solea senegalensis TaxID=28829 RepID=A0AAV6QXC0_SOLSE|nr:hypothetical protein JOB18_046298 [Solea senegalensis]